VEFPLIPGHEPSGVVESPGAGVDAFKPGDPVIIQPSGYCRACRQCREGRTHYCEKGFTTGGDGGATTWPGAVRGIHEDAGGLPFPEAPGLSFDAAALTEPLSGA
jgi:threonine dehydrogenase-like Zn-dependent dehydrogenase